jgi:RNA-splicing ligase RtcB
MSFSCNNLPFPEVREKIQRIRNHVLNLAHPLVCLPNIHPKEGLEAPPQFVAATKNAIVPQLTAPAMNCGISVFTTTLGKEDITDAFIIEFAKNLRAGAHPWLSRWHTALQWFGLYRRPKTYYDLSREELEDMFLNGAAAALRRYNLPPAEAGRMEYNGSVLSETEKRGTDLSELAPRSAYINGRHEMGYNFGGNHFLEFHYVEKINDALTAQKWGIRENHVLMVYHGGGGHATYHLGRYFGRREKNTRFEKFALFWLKALFHFGSRNGIKNMRERWRAYFSRTPFPATPISSPEGRRLMLSIKIALNYGYAFRAALLRRIIDAMPKKETGVAFLWDAAHNSIREEKIGAEDFIVHRQDAVRVFPEKPVIIAGFHTLSYLGVGQAGAEATIHSATPSAGKTIARFEKEEKSKPDFSHYTLVSKRKEPDLRRAPHKTSEGLFAVTNELEHAGIIKPVAFLRPIATIKGH